MVFFICIYLHLLCVNPLSQPVWGLAPAAEAVVHRLPLRLPPPLPQTFRTWCSTCGTSSAVSSWTCRPAWTAMTRAQVRSPSPCPTVTRSRWTRRSGQPRKPSKGGPRRLEPPRSPCFDVCVPASCLCYHGMVNNAVFCVRFLVIVITVSFVHGPGNRRSSGSVWPFELKAEVLVLALLQ